jgi:hypothetical protein
MGSTRVAHRGHGEEQVDNRDWQHGWVRGNGKAIAMAGWGHLLLPFLFGRGVEARPGFTEDLRRQGESGESCLPR